MRDQLPGGTNDIWSRRGESVRYWLDHCRMTTILLKNTVFYYDYLS